MASENEFLLHALLMGIFITFIYDILRIFRRVIPHGKFAVSVEDLFFWIYCAARVFLLMHHESNGTLRWFAVFGALVGMLLYKKLFSGFFVKWVSFGLHKVVQFLVKIVSIIFYPFRTAGRKAAGAAKKAKKSVWGKGGRLCRLLKKKLTFFLKVLKMNLWRT